MPYEPKLDICNLDGEHDMSSGYREDAIDKAIMQDVEENPGHCVKCDLGFPHLRDDGEDD